MEWISVKDRLPEQGQKVLAWGKEDYKRSYYRYLIVVHWKRWDEIPGTETHRWENRYEDYDADGITHWMPLPLSPAPSTEEMK